MNTLWMHHHMPHSAESAADDVHHDTVVSYTRIIGSGEQVTYPLFQQTLCTLRGVFATICLHKAPRSVRGCKRCKTRLLQLAYTNNSTKVEFA